MGKKQIEEILSRLTALEARLGATAGGPPPPPPTTAPPGLGEGFDEKRTIDLIVRLTAEQVEHTVARIVSQKLGEHRVDEKRLVDAIARTVTERVEEIGVRMRREWKEGAPPRDAPDDVAPEPSPPRTAPAARDKRRT